MYYYGAGEGKVRGKKERVIGIPGRIRKWVNNMRRGSEREGQRGK